MYGVWANPYGPPGVAPAAAEAATAALLISRTSGSADASQLCRSMADSVAGDEASAGKSGQTITSSTAAADEAATIAVGTLASSTSPIYVGGGAA